MHDMRSAVSARFYSFLKQHPGIRRGALSSYTTASRMLARTRHPFSARSSRPIPTPDTIAWADSWNQRQNPPVEVTHLSGGEEIHNDIPRSIHSLVDDEYRMAASSTVPAPFVVTIPHGRSVGEHGAIVTPDGKLLQDVSWPVGSLRSHMLGVYGSVPGGEEFFVDASLPPRQVTGIVAVLSAYVGRGYFHWLWDVLPRVGLLTKAGFEVSSIDSFVVPAYMSGFQTETLRSIGIGRSRVISSFQSRHIQADLLLVPSLPRPTGVVPTWAINYMREAFPPSRPSVDPVPTRIYIVRRATDHGILESEARLTRQLVKRGFVPLAMEDFTLREKAWLLGRAEAVIGPSGAGLCNIAFCEPGTKVIEIRIQPYPVMEPWDIANRCGLDFYDVLPIGYSQANKAMVTSGRVAQDEIMATLDMAGL